MGAKRYSAGTIFLQVSPVFANFQKQVKDRAKDIDSALGDQLEKSGEKAGERAGKAASKSIAKEIRKGSGEFERDFRKSVDGINSALNGIDIKKLSNGMRKELTQIKGELNSLKDVDLTVDADFKDAQAKTAALEGRLRAMRDSAKVVFRADIDQALRGFSKIEAAKAAISDPVEIEIKTGRQLSAFEKSFKKSVDKAAASLSGSLGSEARKIREELENLSDQRIGVDLSSAAATRELREISERVEKLSREDVDLDVKVASGAALAELARFSAAVDAVDGTDVDVKAKVDSDAAERKLFRLTRTGQDASNSFRSFNAVMLAGAGIGPALIPVLGGIAGALLAIGPAAAVASFGIGSVLVGFSGIGDGVKALQDREEDAAKAVASSGKTEAALAKKRQAIARARVDGARRIADAQRGVADAERRSADAARAVEDARRSAGRAIKAALEQQRDAQRSYRDSVIEVKDAEQALREARQAAKGTGADLDRKIEGNELALDQALLDSFDATVNYNAVQEDGSSTNAEQEQARIDREEALLRLRELRAEAKDLAAEKKKWDKEGVNGTEEVESAQDQLNDAIDSQKDAYRALGEAAQAVDQARADGARQVQDALRAQAEAQRGVADAHRAVGDAERDAREGVADAMQSYTDAADQAADQAARVSDEFDKLGPAGKRFARFIDSLRDDFYRFRNDIQAVMLPSIEQAISGFLGSKNGGVLRQALINLADGFGRFAIALSSSFQGEAWGSFFQMLARLGPDIQAAYGDAFISLLEAMASILTTLAPFALRFAEAFATLMDRFAEWASSKEGSDAFLRFITYVTEIGPDVMRFIGAFIDGMVNLMIALAPYAGLILELLTEFFEYIANMDPGTLGAAVSAILALVTASQVAYLFLTFLIGAVTLLSSTIALVIFAIVAIGLAIAYLYRENKSFRDFIKDAWAQISESFRAAYEDFIKPALDNLWEALKQLWDEVLAPFFAWLGPVILWAAKILIPLLAFTFGVVINVIAALIKYVLIPVLKLMGSAFRSLWEYVLKPLWGYMKKAWSDLMKDMRSAWTKYLKPTWNAISEALLYLWEKVFLVAFKDMGEAWRNFVDGLRKVWNRYLKPVFDYIADRALPELKKSFKKTVSDIEKIWETLRKIVGAPIRFVIEKVLNGGLIAGFNKVAKFVGSKGIKDIPVPKWTYATGGVLPGYTPGRDVHHFTSPTGGRLHLSGGEAIMRPEWTHAVGRGYIDKMNLIASRGGAKAVQRAVSGGGDAHFKKGGVVWPVPGRRTSNYAGHDGVDINRGSGADDYGDPIVSATSGMVSYVGSGRGYGNAVFITSPYGQLVYGHMSSYGPVRGGQMVQPGQFIGRVGSTGNSSAPHLHFGFPGGSPAAALALLNGAASANYKVGDGNGVQTPSLPKWIKAAMKSPVGWIKDKISGGIGKLKEKFGDSGMMDMIKGVPSKLVSLVGGKIKKMLGNSDKIEAAVSSSSVAGDLTGSVATGEAQKIVQSMAAARGWDGAQWAALKELIRRESSWNPNAANPNSSARGLFQKMTSIHGAIEPTIQGQATWGLNYIASRYGSPSKALAFHNSHGYYRDGGVIGEESGEAGGGLPYNGTMMYDSGGMIPPGLTSVMNLTGKPEPVFTDNQWSNIENGGDSGGNIHYEPHFVGTDLGPEDVAADLNFQFRRLKRGGRYKKVGSQ